MTMYFGGFSNRNNAVFQVRHRDTGSTSVNRIEANSNGVYLGGRVTGPSSSTGNIVGSGGEAYYENGSGGNNLFESTALRANGIRAGFGSSATIHFYIGTNEGGEARVTNSAGRNAGGTIGYRDIRAREFNESSSRTLKTNIEPMTENALAEINKLTIVNFNLIDDLDRGIFDNKTGLIAEDSPTFATEDNMAIRTNKLVMYGIKSVQELSSHVDDEISWLKTENQFLKNEIQILKEQIA
jgi:hypothetical protein